MCVCVCVTKAVQYKSPTNWKTELDGNTKHIQENIP
jgi:hypothetical protein